MTNMNKCFPEIDDPAGDLRQYVTPGEPVELDLQPDVPANDADVPVGLAVAAT
ncbi:MAG: hypothetical protein H0T17_05295 [Propionibacteriales bacterium]|nr:hypothetical protein [Propionibacteriales bacterium]